ncbi:MAG: DUF2723 domain-containing protein [Bdellovibrionales bacterium]|nr:DUF2723 domain-containing protein [Bdellovibrionales bacterium]
MRLFFAAFIWLTSFLWFWWQATPYSIPGTNALANVAFQTGSLLNPPGYPLFVLFSLLFQWLPLPTEILGPLMASLCGAFSFTFGYLIVTEIAKKTHVLSFLSYLLICCGLLLFALHPLAIAQFSHLEKYSVSTLFLMLYLFVLFRCLCQTTCSHKNLYLIAFLSGILISAHYQYLAIVAGTACWIFFGVSPTRSLTSLAKTLFFFILGLTPFLLLVIRSFQQPILDWGDPESFSLLLDLVFRKQYQGLSLPNDLSLFAYHWQHQYSFLIDPYWYVLCLPFFLYFVWNQRKFLWPWILLTFLVASGELVSQFIRFYNPFTGSPSINAGFDRMMWPFYLPWWMLLSISSTLGLAIFYSKVSQKSLRKGLVLLVSSLVIVGMGNQIRKGPYPAVLPEWTKNIEAIVDEQTLIITSIDFFYFALLEAQLNQKFPLDVPVIHASLIQMPWYLDSLQRVYQIDFRQKIPSWKNFQQQARQFFSGQLSAEMTLRGYNQMMSEILKWKSKVLVIESPHLMPLYLEPIWNYRRQPFVFGYFLFQKASEVLPLPWDKWTFNELAKTNSKDHPWSQGVKAMLQEQWFHRKTMEKVLFPNNEPEWLLMEEQLGVF